MEKIIINESPKLRGKIEISSSKNITLAILAGSILINNKITLINIPFIKDVTLMQSILLQLGAEITIDNTGLELINKVAIIDSSKIYHSVVDYDIVKKMRASIFTMGPLLTRFGICKISVPGGCAIGVRGINLHLDAMKSLGAEIDIVNGYIFAKASRLNGAKITFPINSVGATENAIMAACLAKGETLIENAAIEPEVCHLCYFLQKAGAKIEGAGTRNISIQGVDNLSTPLEYNLPPDRIEACSYAIAVAVTDGDVILTNCTEDDFLSSREVFFQIGIGFEKVKDGIRVFKRHDFQSIKITTAPYPGFETDLQAQLMIPLCIGSGISIITESIYDNRFMHVLELNRLGTDITVHGNVATINPVKYLSGANVMATDLRASFCLIIAGLISKNRTIIDRVYHIDRGYENVINKLKSCGANIERLL